MEVPRVPDTDLLHFQSWPSPLYGDGWLIAPQVPPPGKDSSFILIALMWPQSTCLLFVTMCPSLQFSETVPGTFSWMKTCLADLGILGGIGFVNSANKFSEKYESR